MANPFLELADDRMADAIARVSTRRGYDPADHALVAFGGAGPQHACAIAERLDASLLDGFDDVGQVLLRQRLAAGGRLTRR